MLATSPLLLQLTLERIFSENARLRIPEIENIHTMHSTQCDIDRKATHGIYRQFWNSVFLLHPANDFFFYFFFKGQLSGTKQHQALIICGAIFNWNRTFL